MWAHQYPCKTPCLCNLELCELPKYNVAIVTAKKTADGHAGAMNVPCVACVLLYCRTLEIMFTGGTRQQFSPPLPPIIGTQLQHIRDSKTWNKTCQLCYYKKTKTSLQCRAL